METIKTKFSMGDEVWFMYKNTATSSKIISITATICFNSLYSTDNNSPMNIRINYKLELTYRVNKDMGTYLTHEDVNVEMPQHKVFKTKEELLNSL